MAEMNKSGGGERASGGTAIHPLKHIPHLDAATHRTLAGNWIENAEQVIALAVSPEGRTGLKRLLNFDDAKLDELLKLLMAEVGSEAVRRLQTPPPPHERGLRLTEEQKKRFGVKED